MLDAADRLDQLGDMPNRGFHRGARLGNLVHGGRLAVSTACEALAMS